MDHCVKCPSCSIMEGLAGAGAFSDGKYVISTEYGGWLPEFLKPETVLDYIEQADAVLQHFGAPSERFMPSDELKKKCLAFDLHMSQAQLKHLGTDANFDTMRKMAQFLKEHVTILTDTNVTDVEKATHTVHYENAAGGGQISAAHIVWAVGRSGSRNFSMVCSNGIPMQNNQVDLACV